MVQRTSSDHPPPLPPSERDSISQAHHPRSFLGVVRQFGAHLLEMPRWHKTVLVLALAATAIGLLRQTARRIGAEESPPPAGQAPNANPPATPHTPGSGFVHSDAPPTAAPANPPAAAEPSPWLSRAGISLIAGFVIGWLFRAFVKTMAILTAAVAALFVLLSYANVMNVDLTTAHRESDTAAAWVSDQGSRLAHGLANHLPSSTSGALGMFMGFRRRR